MAQNENGEEEGITFTVGLRMGFMWGRAGIKERQELHSFIAHKNYESGFVTYKVDCCCSIHVSNKIDWAMNLFDE